MLWYHVTSLTANGSVNAYMFSKSYVRVWPTDDCSYVAGHDFGHIGRHKSQHAHSSIASVKISASVLSPSAGCSLFFWPEAVGHCRLFAMYVSPVGGVVAAPCSIRCYQYADQHLTQWRHFRVILYACQRRRLLIPRKLAASLSCQDEAVLFGTKVRQQKIPVASGNRQWRIVPSRDTVKLLGVTLESVLTMDRQSPKLSAAAELYHTHVL